MRLFSKAAGLSGYRATGAVERRGFFPNQYDLAAIALILAGLVLVVAGGRQMTAPMAGLGIAPISLDPTNLPAYALRTVLRMFAGVIASLVFTFIFATAAAKSRKAEIVIIPALDILQSIPVLGFLTFTVTFFLGLFPESQLGGELAVIFAIFTAQAWNMAFSFYQSLRSVPHDLDEASRAFQLSGWQRFWRLEVPFATPGLVWNTMLSMSGAWFFIVASEAISVGDTTVKLPGIGAYLALAIDQADVQSVLYAVGAMAVVILLYDQLIFRPIVAWADKFRVETTASQARPSSWIYDLARRTRLVHTVTGPLSAALGAVSMARLPRLSLGSTKAAAGPAAKSAPRKSLAKLLDWAWIAVVLAVAAWGFWTIYHYVSETLTPSDLVTAVGLSFLTLLRVIALIALSTLIWVPIGVWIGLRPAWTERIQPLAQFLAAFPANVLYPIAVIVIVRFDLNPDIWLTLLIMLGAQWYILFNVIAGASVFPNDLKEAASVLGLRSWNWWRRVILPGIFPYYVTGALTASGGAWNASIVAEIVKWGDTTLKAKGIGAYIAQATSDGDFPRVVLGIAAMSIFVIVFNRLVWRRLYAFAAERTRLD
ncbi:NitT/TauT family transport system permease protein [Rhizobiales bacterium GAS191]|nr:NitT/TauT family transport system permease protein [Rhizobiales bacterium GAS191]SEE76272.1 NitT/TauT family transport system permease protein [Rhizobiales bacterium GAS188]